jgi:anti-anti-sigma factor
MFEIVAGPDGTVKLSGRLDASQAENAQRALREFTGPLTADCTDLDYISSAGITVLLEVHRRLCASGHEFRLLGMSPRVRTVFVYTGLDKILKIL